jgi:catechol 2,3-dioxygenase-like lactoylglutathione lyase family enzyme
MFVSSREEMILRTYGVWHFSFTVSNIDAAVAFYRDLLGFTVVHRQIQDNEYTQRLVGYPGARLEVAQLAVPGQPRGLSTHDLELVQYLHPEGTMGERQIKDPGQAHLAIAVSDADATYERLTAAGVEFISAPNSITAGVNRGGKACYFRGPDDIVHELLEPPVSQTMAYDSAIAAEALTAAPRSVQLRRPATPGRVAARRG